MVRQSKPDRPSDAADAKSKSKAKADDVADRLDKLPKFVHLRIADLPGRESKLVITTAGIVALGEAMADGYLKHR
jgi:hypothetical protein